MHTAKHWAQRAFQGQGWQVAWLETGGRWHEIVLVWLRKRAVKSVDEGVELSWGCADVGAGAQAFRIG